VVDLIPHEDKLNLQATQYWKDGVMDLILCEDKLTVKPHPLYRYIVFHVVVPLIPHENQGHRMAQARKPLSAISRETAKPRARRLKHRRVSNR